MIHDIVTQKAVAEVSKIENLYKRWVGGIGPLLEVAMSKSCTPLWREATFRSQNVQNTRAPDHFWKLRCRKSARRCGAKHILKSKCTKHRLRTTFGSWAVEKVHAVVARSRFWSQKCKKLTGTEHLWTFGCASKVSKTRGFCSISKSDGRRGTFEEDLQRCISRGRRSTKDMFIRDVRRSGRWFPERGCILEHHIFRFAEMILRDRCSTSYDLASLFRGRRSTFDRWTGKIAKRIGTKLLALHSTFQSRRIALFLMLSSWKIEEVSQKCFVCDVVNFEKWGSLADLLRFWCGQLQKMRRSRRIASFSSLQLDRQTDRQTNR